MLVLREDALYRGTRGVFECLGVVTSGSVMACSDAHVELVEGAEESRLLGLACLGFLEEREQVRSLAEQSAHDRALACVLFLARDAVVWGDVADLDLCEIVEERHREELLPVERRGREHERGERYAVRVRGHALWGTNPYAFPAFAVHVLERGRAAEERERFARQGVVGHRSGAP